MEGEREGSIDQSITHNPKRRCSTCAHPHHTPPLNLTQLFKFTILLRPHADFLVDRYSEREEKKQEGRLLSQAEKEARARKDKQAATAAAAVAAMAATAANANNGGDAASSSSSS